MTDVFLVVLIVLNVLILIDRLPMFARMTKQNKFLEHQIRSKQNEINHLMSENRLHRSDKDRLAGRIAGLEIELETAQREAEDWKNLSIERKRTLIMRGIEKG